MCYSNSLKILGFFKYPVVVYLMAQCGYDLMIVYFDCTYMLYIWPFLNKGRTLVLPIVVLNFFLKVEIRFAFVDTLACQS